MERFLDIIISLFLLLFLSPVLIIIIIIQKFTGEGEIFFAQERIGRNEIKFKILKFATMLKNSPYIGTKDITLEDDRRVLPFGKFLRKTKLNEVPQLINILKGDMSFVGPRPFTNKIFQLYNLSQRKKIKLIKPGLTSVASIIFRNEEKLFQNKNFAFEKYKNIISPYKARLEIWYNRKKNIKNYFLIFFLTAWVVIFPDSKIIWKIYSDIPKTPKNLKFLLKV